PESTNNSPEQQCKKHKKSLQFFCIKCNKSLCEKGWEVDHKDPSKHQVVLFKFILEPQNEVRERIQQYRDECEQTSRSMMNNFNIFLKDVRELQDKHNDVMNSSNNAELQKRADIVKKLVENHKKSLKEMQNENLKQFEVINDLLSNLLTSKTVRTTQMPGDVDTNGTLVLSATANAAIGSGQLTKKKAKRTSLKSTSIKFVLQENQIECLDAVYNLSTQLVICLDGSTNTVHLLSINSERNNLVLEHTLDWKEVRRDESDVLCRIAMTSDNTLYAVIMNENDKRHRVSVLRQSDLREEREIDTSLIKEPCREGYRWELIGCGNRLAIVIRLNNKIDKVYRWECVYIYSEERCTHRVTLDIERDYYLVFSLCYIGSHLIVRTSNDSVAVVSLDERDSIRQKETEKKKNENRRETKSGRSEQHGIEERRATDIKHITLIDTNGIWGLVWLGRDGDEDVDGYDEVEEGNRQRQKSAQGYLFVGDYAKDEKCSVYELDLDRVKDGDSVNSRKDLQIIDMFPVCMIDKSNIFAIKGMPFFKGNPSIVALEFD
ncbi:uncharacterized protein LOC142356436, partial [Convolutriloba macropyga]|uniref:uncharacterized protein LOC142356436 n=1 Tax=Convolutriloba macropyga TaxID=536237 RepID=UPI003F528E00